MRTREIRDSLISASFGVGLTLLIMTGGMRDAPGTEESLVKLCPLAIVLFGSTVATAVNWEKLPQR